MFQYTLVSNGDEANVTVFVPGESMPLVAHSDHPNFDTITKAVIAGEYDGNLADLFDVGRAVAQRFDSLSERVKVANGRIYFDGDEVDNALTKQVVRYLNEGVEDWRSLVAFFEKVQSNPEPHSRDQLFDWLDRHDFTLTPDGDIVGYKGVRKEADGSLVSISAGPAIVDGESVNGNVPNHIGAVVEMPRSGVNHNPSQGCSRGLHVGTYSYASGFAQGALLEVHVNPRDVVSVPTDCNWQKVRCCRYTVVRVIDQQYTSAVLDVDASGDDDDRYGGTCSPSGSIPVGTRVSDPDGDEGVVVGTSAEGVEVEYDNEDYGTYTWDADELDRL
jgi:hypothetical protein